MGRHSTRTWLCLRRLVDTASKSFLLRPFEKSHPYGFGFASVLTFVTSYTVCTLLTPISMTELMCTCPPLPSCNLAWHFGCVLYPTLSLLSPRRSRSSPLTNTTPLCFLSVQLANVPHCVYDLLLLHLVPRENCLASISSAGPLTSSSHLLLHCGL